MLVAHAMSHVITAGPDQGLGRWADDLHPLATVLSGLSQRVDKLTSHLEAQGLKMDLMATQIAAVQQPVTFSASFTSSDVEKITEGATLQFDQVVFNTGGGYDPSTGVFTAPTAGQYAFYLHMTLNVNNPQALKADIYKGHTLLLRVAVCCGGVDAGSNMTTVNLEKGETVHVRLVTEDKLLGAFHSSFTGLKLNPQ